MAGTAGCQGTEIKSSLRTIANDVAIGDLSPPPQTFAYQRRTAENAEICRRRFRASVRGSPKRKVLRERANIHWSQGRSARVPSSAHKP